METLLDRNLQAWASTGAPGSSDPNGGAAVRVSLGGGSATLLLSTPAGRWVHLHSGRDPHAEADRLIAPAFEHGAPPLVVVIGLGLGYMLDAIERRSTDTKVLALEPVPNVVAPLLERRDWSAWLTTGRLRLLVGPAYRGASDAWRGIDWRGAEPPVLVNAVLARETPAEVERAIDTAARIVSGARNNAEARRRFAGPYLTNTLRNLRALTEESDAASLVGLFAGQPATIVGAGPSLDANIEQVRHACGSGALTIALSTAARPLIDAGISPHILVSVDPGEVASRHLRELAVGQDTWLVCEGSTLVCGLELFAGRTFFFQVSNHHPWPWLSGLGLGKGSLKAWGGVMSCAFDLAVKMGCTPIIFAGADLAYTRGRPYCRGTSYEVNWAESAKCGMGLPDAWEHWVTNSASVETPTRDGTLTRASGMMIAVRDWLIEQMAQLPGRRFINTTDSSILYGGPIEHTTLSAALKSAGPSPSTSVRRRLADAWLAGRDRGAGDPSALDLAGDAIADSTLAAWREFASGTLTNGDILAARDAGTARSNRRAVVDGAVEAHRVSRVPLIHLPERLMLLRTLLNGSDWPDWVSVLPPPADDSEADARRELLALRLEEALALIGALIGERVTPQRDAPAESDCTRTLLAISAALEASAVPANVAAIERSLAEALWLAGPPTAPPGQAARSTADETRRLVLALLVVTQHLTTGRDHPALAPQAGPTTDRAQTS